MTAGGPKHLLIPPARRFNIRDGDHRLRPHGRDSLVGHGLRLGVAPGLAWMNRMSAPAVSGRCRHRATSIDSKRELSQVGAGWREAHESGARRAATATKAKIQLSANPKALTTATDASAPSTPAWKRKPIT